MQKEWHLSKSIMYDDYILHTFPEVYRWTPSTHLTVPLGGPGGTRMKLCEGRTTVRLHCMAQCL